MEESTALRSAEVEGCQLRIETVGGRRYDVRVDVVRVTQSDRDGTYVKVRETTGYFFPPYIKEVTILVRTSEQKETWEKNLREAMAPRDVLPKVV